MDRDLKRHTLPRPVWLPESVWPCETFGLDVRGARLAVTDIGQGPALLFVHTGSWSFIWRDLMGRLSEGFRCICFDAPGNGRSTPLVQREAALETAARAASDLIAALRLERFTLVVHDLGGVTGLAAAASTPGRVSGIVAMNTFAWRPTERPLRFMLALMGSALVREFDVLTNVVSRIGSSAFGVGRHLDEASRRAFREGTSREGRRGFHNYLRDARRCDALYREVGAALTGPFAPLPMLTVFGERNDPFDFQGKWKALFPHAVQVVVPAGHHFPMCDAPDLVAEAICSWHLDKVRTSSAEAKETK